MKRRVLCVFSLLFWLHRKHVRFARVERLMTPMVEI